MSPPEQPWRRRPLSDWSWAVASLSVVALMLLRPSVVVAQCRPPASSHEARLLAFYAAPIAFSTANGPAALPVWGVRLGVEVAPVPVPTASLRRTSLCYQSTEQSTRLAPLFGRPRLTVGLPAGFSIEGSYLPPITIDGATPSLGSIALARTQALPGSAGRARLALRVHGTAGTVRGAITCAREALQTTDADAPCYGTHPSRDTFRPDMYGAEAAVGVLVAHARMTVFGGAGVSWLRPQFRVGFTDHRGATDTTRVLARLTRLTVVGGATAQVTGAFDISVQVFSTPADVTTWKLGAGYRLR